MDAEEALLKELNVWNDRFAPNNDPNRDSRYSSAEDEDQAIERAYERTCLLKSKINPAKVR